jgi:hypothetical protein
MTSAFQFKLPGNRPHETSGEVRWTAAQSIRSFGVCIGLRTNSVELLAELPAYFPPLWKPVSAATVDRIFSLRTNKAGYSLFEDDALVLQTSSRSHVLKDFQRRLKMYVAEMARRRVFVHAGAVGWQGQAILLPGRSYSGKTTLVRELVQAGATYYSDEYAVLDLQGRVHPYPQPLGLRKPGTFEQKDCSVIELGGVVGTAPLPVGWVMVCSYRANARWRPVRLTIGQGVLALLDNTVPARRKPEVVLPVLQQALLKATILKGHRNEASAVAKSILERVINF